MKYVDLKSDSLNKGDIGAVLKKLIMFELFDLMVFREDGLVRFTLLVDLNGERYCAEHKVKFKPNDIKKTTKSYYISPYFLENAAIKLQESITFTFTEQKMKKIEMVEL